MNDMDRVIERVRKMLALANDAGATEGERDNAMRMAHATLAKYNLDLATINSTLIDPTRDATVEPRTEYRTTFYGRPWARLLSQGVAELMFCRYLFVQNSVAKYTTHVFIGSHANAISASLLAEYLVDSIVREGKRRQRDAGAGNAYFRSFATGAAIRVTQRCIELRTAPRAPGGAATGPDPGDPAIPQPPGTAIVLAGVYEREATANAAYVDKLNPSRKDPKFGNLDQEAAAAGFVYGGKVSLNRQVK